MSTYCKLQNKWGNFFFKKIRLIYKIYTGHKFPVGLSHDSVHLVAVLLSALITVFCRWVDFSVSTGIPILIQLSGFKFNFNCLDFYALEILCCLEGPNWIFKIINKLFNLGDKSWLFSWVQSKHNSESTKGPGKKMHCTSWGWQKPKGTACGEAQKNMVLQISYEPSFLSCSSSSADNFKTSGITKEPAYFLWLASFSMPSYWALPNSDGLLGWA